MNEELQKPESGGLNSETTKKNRLLPVSILVSALILAGAWVYTTGLKDADQQRTNLAATQEKAQASELEEKVLPSEGVILPITWGDLGQKLVSADAIDAERFKAIYDQRGAFTDEYKNLLLGQNDGNLKMTMGNSSYLLNLFWALGFASKNPILESGEMTNPKYGGAGNFASTAGWTIAAGNPMDHYSRHLFFNLT